MIEFTKAYKTSDGQTFATIEEAQKHEIFLLYGNTPRGHGGTNEVESWVNWILAQADFLVDVLTTKPNSKPRDRSLHGGTKKRTAKVQPSTATPNGN